MNYWWINAKPSEWSFSNIKEGETVDFTLYNDKGNQRKIFRNFFEAKKGDMVICYESTPIKQVVALGRICKEQDKESIGVEKTNNLSVPIKYEELRQLKELSQMEFHTNSKGTIFKLSEEEYTIIMEAVRKANALGAQVEKCKEYGKKDFLNEVFLSEQEYNRLSALLKNRKNVILQGAPGVGKTFTAKRLAYSMMGVADEKRIGFVQFHQNYSYEDFMMGYKPDKEGFELKEGIFYKFCKKAEKHPGEDYFFIIDEINRGNMSKIFGELLVMIEKDYRGKEMTLAYHDRLFSVPENLYLIGMMNTADRSLAMIDYALRRRFSFFEMAPGFSSEGFKNYQKSLDNKFFDKLIDEIQQLNQEIVKDASLGEGFLIGHSYFCNQDGCTQEWLKQIVDYDILPTLKEYWFDDTEKYTNWEKRLTGMFHDE